MDTRRIVQLSGQVGPVKVTSIMERRTYHEWSEYMRVSRAQHRLLCRAVRLVFQGNDRAYAFDTVSVHCNFAGVDAQVMVTAVLPGCYGSHYAARVAWYTDKALASTVERLYAIACKTLLDKVIQPTLPGFELLAGE